MKTRFIYSATYLFSLSSTRYNPAELHLDSQFLPPSLNVAHKISYSLMFPHFDSI
jgi:hypothetical protein